MHFQLEFCLEDSVVRKVMRLNCRDLLMRNLDDHSYAGDFSNLCSEEAVDFVVEDVYCKIARLMLHFTSLRTQRNATIAIAKLPAELLQKIFLYCVAQPSSCDRTRNDLAFSQVSTRWRQLALEYPRLWTQPDFSRPKLAEEMIKRAGTSPLTIDFDLAHSLNLASCEVFARVMMRGQQLKVLRLECSSLMIPGVLGSLPTSMPLLECLAIHSLKGYAQLAGRLEEVDAPAIHTVSLQYCAIPMTARFLSGLTNLTICTHGYDKWRANLPDIVEMLKRNPSLQTLVLQGACKLVDANKAITSDSSHGDVALLVHLTSLQIDDDIFNSVRLLSCFHMPALLRLEVNDTSRVCISGQTAKVQRIINQFYRTLEVAGKQHPSHLTWNISQYARRRIYLEVLVWDTSQQPHGQLAPEVLHFDVLFEDMAAADEFLVTLVQTFPMQHLTRLEAHNELVGGRSLDAFWEHISRVSSLKIIKFDAAIPCQLLSSVNEDGVSAGRKHPDVDTIAFPGLELMTLRNIGNEEYSDLGCTAFDIIRSYLELRKSLGFKKPTLVFEGHVSIADLRRTFDDLAVVGEPL